MAFQVTRVFVLTLVCAAFSTAIAQSGAGQGGYASVQTSSAPAVGSNAGMPVVDGDNDGIPDEIDDCPYTPPHTRVNSHGCSDTGVDSMADSDGDGVPDAIDQCPYTEAGAKVDVYGCAIDSDHDGVADGVDLCPKTPAGVRVDVHGCGPAQQQDKKLAAALAKTLASRPKLAPVQPLVPDDQPPALLASQTPATPSQAVSSAAPVALATAPTVAASIAPKVTPPPAVPAIPTVVQAAPPSAPVAAAPTAAAMPMPSTPATPVVSAPPTVVPVSKSAAPVAMNVPAVASITEPSAATPPASIPAAPAANPAATGSALPETHAAPSVSTSAAPSQVQVQGQSPVSEVRFSKNSTELSPDEQHALDALIPKLRTSMVDNPNMRIEIAGDAATAEILADYSEDATSGAKGKAKKSKSDDRAILATRRAELVRAYLLANDLPAKRIKATRSSVSRNESRAVISVIEHYPAADTVMNHALNAQ